MSTTTWLEYAEHILRGAAKFGADAEVFIRLTEVTEVDSGTVVAEAFRASNTLVTVRLLLGGRLGWVTSSPPIRADELLATAKSTARFGPTVPWTFRFNQGQVAWDPNPPPAHPDVESLHDHVVATSKKAGDAVTIHVAARIRSNWRLVANSGGLRVAGPRQGVKVSLTVKPAQVRGRPPLLVEGEGPDLSTATKRAIKAATRRFHELDAPLGWPPDPLPPVVLAPPAATQVVLLLLHRTCIVDAGPLCTEGCYVEWPAGLEIRDEPLLDQDVRGFDDEGVTIRPLLLVKDGQVQGRIADLDRAARFGLEPTGHALRDDRGLPSPTFHRVVLRHAGGHPNLELAMLDRALVIYRLSLADPDEINRIMAMIQEGVVIHRGQPVCRIRGGTLIASMRTLLRDALPLADPDNDNEIPHLLLGHHVRVQASRT